MLRTIKLSAVSAGLLFLFSTQVSADLIYFGNLRGGVGVYDTVPGSLSFLGDLDGVSSRSESLRQVIGLAYDPVGDRILLCDDLANSGSGDPAQIFAMNPLTGDASLLFTAPRGFRGLAVRDDLLYGINVFSKTVEAFSLTDFTDQGLNAAPLTGTNSGQSLGVDTATGQLYSRIETGFPDYKIVEINPDGSVGNDVVAFNIGVFGDDLDYYQGDFLSTSLDGQNVYRIDGTTGDDSIFLTSSQVQSMGLSGRLTGVAVNAAAISAVPEPSSLALLGLGLCSLLGYGVRRRRNLRATCSGVSQLSA